MEGKPNFENHFAKIQKHFPEYPPLADGCPEINESENLLEYRSTDEIWLYEIDFEFRDQLQRRITGSIAISNEIIFS